MSYLVLGVVMAVFRGVAGDILYDLSHSPHLNQLQLLSRVVVTVTVEGE